MLYSNMFSYDHHTCLCTTTNVNKGSSELFKGWLCCIQICLVTIIILACVLQQMLRKDHRLCIQMCFVKIIRIIHSCLCIPICFVKIITLIHRLLVYTNMFIKDYHTKTLASCVLYTNKLEKIIRLQ